MKGSESLAKFGSRLLNMLAFDGIPIKGTEPMSNLLKLGLPKGSLQESTFHLFSKAGYKVSSTSRSYFPNIDDPEMKAMLIRAQEMSRYVEDGTLDVGMTGRDWVKENGSDVIEIAELIYAKQGLRPVRWVLAARSIPHQVGQGPAG